MSQLQKKKKEKREKLIPNCHSCRKTGWVGRQAGLLVGAIHGKSDFSFTVVIYGENGQPKEFRQDI